MVEEFLRAKTIRAEPAGCLPPVVLSSDLVFIKFQVPPIPGTYCMKFNLKDFKQTSGQVNLNENL